MISRHIGPVVTAALLVAPLHASADEFYKTANIKLLIGHTAGSSYDASARLLGRHLGRHIPGQPSLVPVNMTGAAGLVAANYLYNQAPQDGSVILAAHQMVAQRQAMREKNVRFDASKLQWLGSITRSVDVLSVWHTAPAKTIEDAKKVVTLLGVTAPNSAASSELALSNNLLGTKFRQIAGYRGSGQVHLAMEKGEVHGRPGESYNDLKIIRQDWLRDGKITILLQFGLEKDPELSDVPLALDLVTSDEHRKVLEFYSSSIAIGRSFVVGQDVPADRVATLRAAFDATMKDPKLLADSKTMGFTVTPTSWRKLQEIVARTLSTPKPIIKKAKEFMTYKEQPAPAPGAGR